MHKNYKNNSLWYHCEHTTRSQSSYDGHNRQIQNHLKEAGARWKISDSKLCRKATKWAVNIQESDILYRSIPRKIPDIPWNSKNSSIVLWISLESQDHQERTNDKKPEELLLYHLQYGKSKANQERAWFHLGVGIFMSHEWYVGINSKGDVRHW